MSDLTLFDLDDTESAWEPIYRHFNLIDLLRGQVCRDCGRTKFVWTHGCGGGRPGLGQFELCDDCAALDGRGQRSDGADDCSRWGIRTTDDEAARLSALQRDRRAASLRSNRKRALGYDMETAA